MATDNFDAVPVSVRGQGDGTLESPPAGNAVAKTDQQRAIAEVHAAMVIARMNPRDPVKALDRILNACCRPALAQVALYNYARGGSDVSGVSIRLAEALAQNWGNLQYGIRELEQRPGESTVQAYAWDVETNTRREVTFQVPHVRYTKKDGLKRLTDPRDVYEMAANMGARRVRACILGIIPGDVVEAAVEQCEATLKAAADTTPEGVKKVVEAFAEQFGVTKEQIEKRIQRRVEAIQPAQVVSLRKIFLSLRDSMSAVEDWFEPVIAMDGKASSLQTKNAGEALVAAPATAQAPHQPVVKPPADPGIPAADPVAAGLTDAQGELLDEINEILLALAGNDAAKRKALMLSWTNRATDMITKLRSRPELLDMTLDRARVQRDEADAARAEAQKKGKLL